MGDEENLGPVDWAVLNAKLPYERTTTAQEKRKDLFKEFDNNRNGYISLDEVRYLVNYPSRLSI